MMDTRAPPSPMAKVEPYEREASGSSAATRSPPLPTVIPLETVPGVMPSNVKISCLACRMAKRKCMTPDAQTICRRCHSQSLTCEYTKHRRGRKRKERVEDEEEGVSVGGIGPNGASRPGEDGQGEERGFMNGRGRGGTRFVGDSPVGSDEDMDELVGYGDAGVGIEVGVGQHRSPPDDIRSHHQRPPTFNHHDSTITNPSFSQSHGYSRDGGGLGGITGPGSEQALRRSVSWTAQGNTTSATASIRTTHNPITFDGSVNGSVQNLAAGKSNGPDMTTRPNNVNNNIGNKNETPSSISKRSYANWATPPMSSMDFHARSDPQAQAQGSNTRGTGVAGPGPSSSLSSAYAQQSHVLQHAREQQHHQQQSSLPGTSHVQTLLRNLTPDQHQLDQLAIAALGPAGKWATGSSNNSNGPQAQQVGSASDEFNPAGSSAKRRVGFEEQAPHSGFLPTEHQAKAIGGPPVNMGALLNVNPDLHVSSSSSSAVAGSSGRPPSSTEKDGSRGLGVTNEMMDGNNESSADPSIVSRNRFNIQFSHVVPDVGDSAPFLPPRSDSRPKDSEPADTRSSGDSARNEGLDPISAGLMTETDALRLFEFYFRHLNVTVAILDPVLHTASYCRRKSSLLFTAVLTVTAKIHLPKVYASCLLLANKLCGHAFELGLCAIEIVQALNLLTHWKKSDDGTSWRRVGFAIRMAQELRLNVKGARPLPINQIGAREVLNRERAWLNLIVADYHLAIHHSLPRMINDEDIDDPTEWIMEHPHIACPGEMALGPMIQFSRMCRLYADMLAGMSGDPSNLRLLNWIELEWTRWRGKWLETKKYDVVFLPQQLATLRLCDALFRFHICEYRLLFIARYRSQGQMLDTRDPTPLSFAFSECCDASLALATLFQTEFVELQCLPYCFNLVWVALAIVSVWLIKNIAVMSPSDRGRVIRTLSDVQYSTEQASCTSDDQAAYTTRLLKHLLNDLNPDWHLKSLVGDRSLAANQHSFSLSRPMSPSNIASASQMIQEYLWQHQQPIATDGGGGAEDGNGIPADFMSGGAGANGAVYHADGMMNGINGDHVGFDGTQGVNGGGAGVVNSHGQLHHGHNNNGGHDLLFPADDDVFWKMLFPIAE